MWDEALEQKELDYLNAFFSTHAAQFMVTVSAHAPCESQIPSHQNHFDHLTCVHLNNEYSEVRTC